MILEMLGTIWGVPIFASNEIEKDRDDSKNTVWCDIKNRKLYYKGYYIGMVNEDKNNVDDFQEAAFEALYNNENELGHEPYYVKKEEEKEEEVPPVEEHKTEVEAPRVAPAADLFLESWKDNIDGELNRLLGKNVGQE